MNRDRIGFQPGILPFPRAIPALRFAARASGLIGLLLAAVVCAPFEPRTLPDCRTIGAIPGPGDIVLDQSQRRLTRLLVSSQDRRRRDPNGELMEAGAIYAIPLVGGTPVEPERLSITARDDFPFHPEGLALGAGGGGMQLYVINQALSDLPVVEVFRIERDRLVFAQRLRSGFFKRPQDLVAYPDSSGRFLIANDRDSESFFPWLSASDLTQYRIYDWRRGVSIPGRPRSLELSPDGSRLYLSALDAGGVLVYALDSEGRPFSRPEQRYVLPAAPDGLALESSQTLLVAAHPDPGALAEHAEDSARPAPSEVYRINLQSGAVARIFANDGRLISGASTVFSAEGRLYLGGRYERGLLSCAAAY